MYAYACIYMYVYMYIYTYIYIYGVFVKKRLHTVCGSCWQGLTTLHHTATHCNTLQHTATHCNTLTATLYHMHHACFLFLNHGVAMISRVPESQGLFCKRALF